MFTGCTNKSSRDLLESRRIGRKRFRPTRWHRPQVEKLEQRALLAAVLVTDGADDGPGTFRAAIEEANDDSAIRVIRFARDLGLIETSSTVEYTGSQRLSILGRDTVIQPAADAIDEFHLLVSSGGADLLIRDLAIQGGSLNGLTVPVPADATGVVSVHLDRVTVADNGLYGVHIDDQSENSAASIRFSMSRTQITGNGFKPGEDDFDGVRIDEGGEGGVVASIRFSTVEGNAADGTEIDEKGNGSVILNASHSRFNDNGTQPQLPSDLEDGLDIDEAGEGSIVAHLVNVQANRNEDEGIDFDEEGKGDLVSTLIGVEASGNLDENIKFSEDADAEPPDPEDFGFDPDADDPLANFDQQAFDEAVGEVNQDAGGDLIANLVGVRANDSRDGDGIRFEEFGLGDLIAKLVFVEADSNDDEGVQISEGSELYTDPLIDTSMDLSGQNAGDMIMRVVKSRVTNNGDKGIQAEQFAVGDDIGRLRIRATLFDNNGDDDIDVDGVELV